jgi:hypothetical protein
MNLRGDPRMAGEVKRWHTYPTLREQISCQPLVERGADCAGHCPYG